MICHPNEGPLIDFMPNATTLKAMEDAKAGRTVKKFKSVDAIFKGLNA